MSNVSRLKRELVILKKQLVAGIITKAEYKRIFSRVTRRIKALGKPKIERKVKSKRKVKRKPKKNGK